MRRLGCAALVITMTVFAGCADWPSRPDPQTQAEPAAVTDCRRWLTLLDQAIDSAGVRDAGAYRVPGFPYLRVDRFLASFRADVDGHQAAFDAWVGRLRALDATARKYELRNLPVEQLTAFGITDRDAALVKLDGCAAVLSRADLAAASRREALIVRAEVPDDYIEWHRVVGLYPLATLPFSIGIDRWQRDTVATFWRAAADAAASKASARYEPAGRPLTAPAVARIFARARRDLLGIPQLSPDDRELLFQTFAPVYEIATAGDDDRFGPLFWGAGPAPAVDVAHPTVYRRLAFTRYGSHVLPQFVFTIWFSQRPPENPFDLQSGRLDGLVFRVTLDPQGRPLVYDTIHPCGCYHMFFPTARAKVRPAPQPGIEWALVPATLPEVDPAYRMVLRVASRSHYLINLHFDFGSRGPVYRFAEDDDLRAVPTLDGGSRSVFGPDGIVPGTERGERLLFWPTGVEDTGAMRQWGRHATAFLGRRHFDDPDLIERRFSITAMETAAQ